MFFFLFNVIILILGIIAAPTTLAAIKFTVAFLLMWLGIFMMVLAFQILCILRGRKLTNNSKLISIEQQYRIGNPFL